jgi:hypothetical protein
LGPQNVLIPAERSAPPVASENPRTTFSTASSSADAEDKRKIVAAQDAGAQRNNPLRKIKI